MIDRKFSLNLLLFTSECVGAGAACIYWFERGVLAIEALKNGKLQLLNSSSISVISAF